MVKIINKSNKKNLEYFFDIIYKAILYMCIFFLLIEVIVLIYTVFGRYVLNSTPTWGEALALLAMVWFSLLSAAIATRNDKHIRLSIINENLNENIKWFLNKILFNILKIIFCIFMIYGGFNLTIQTINSRIPGLGISTSWKYLSMPITGIFIIIMLVEREVIKK